MIPDITDSLLDAMIQSRKMALAGQSYWQQGRVTKLQIDPEMSEISAHVQGSERTPYSVLIYFDDDDFDFGTTTECSCPIGVGCKHCAAVLYAARNQQLPGAELVARNPVAHAKLHPPAKPAALPQLLSFWLAEAQAQAPSVKTGGPEIAYVATTRRLHPVKQPKVQTGGQSAHLSPPTMPDEMSIHVWLKQASTDGKPTWREANRYDRTWSFALQTPIDMWLVKQLTDYNGEMAGGSPKGIGGANWLDQAIATGRLRWRNPDGPVLHWGEGMSASFRWETLATGEQRLALSETPPGLSLMALAPPLLIDGESGAVHRVKPGLRVSWRNVCSACRRYRPMPFPNLLTSGARLRATPCRRPPCAI